MKAFAFGARTHQEFSDGEMISNDGSQSVNGWCGDSAKNSTRAILWAQQPSDICRTISWMPTLLGKWWEVSRGPGKTVWQGPTGNSIHTAKPDIMAALLAGRRGKAGGGIRSWSPEHAFLRGGRVYWFSFVLRDMNVDSEKNVCMLM